MLHSIQIEELLHLVTELPEEVSRLRSIRECEKETDRWNNILPSLMQAQQPDKRHPLYGGPRFHLHQSKSKKQKDKYEALQVKPVSNKTDDSPSAEALLELSQPSPV